MDIVYHYSIGTIAAVTAIGLAHYLLGGISTTWTFILSRTVALTTQQCTYLLNPPYHLDSIQLLQDQYRDQIAYSIRESNGYTLMSIESWTTQHRRSSSSQVHLELTQHYQQVYCSSFTQNQPEIFIKCWENTRKNPPRLINGIGA